MDTQPENFYGHAFKELKDRFIRREGLGKDSVFLFSHCPKGLLPGTDPKKLSSRGKIIHNKKQNLNLILTFFPLINKLTFACKNIHFHRCGCKSKVFHKE